MQAPNPTVIPLTPLEDALFRAGREHGRADGGDEAAAELRRAAAHYRAEGERAMPDDAEQAEAQRAALEQWLGIFDHLAAGLGEGAGETRKRAAALLAQAVAQRPVAARSLHARVRGAIIGAVNGWRTDG